ncbi:hypothetical protein EVAR_23144_1 [Eumeta japonica]|uniref:C2H2-type domain-containing protein n=1 Tax=Eumeta variegata TaxID=151549 RepID=A0A4C1VE29_EUMVA|nr:hypothetical protein EVAR_23144_1 [Eumeta japonica]
MDRVNQLRSEVPESSKVLDNSQSGDHYMTANDVSSKYFSLSDADSTLESAGTKTTSPTKTDTELVDNISGSETNTLISSLSPISQKNDNFEIGKQIEAANILSGGVDIFDNDNSYDGDELVIDDNVTVDTVEEKSNIEEQQINQPDNTPENKIHVNTENTLIDSEIAIRSKDTEVILQIDGKNVDAIDIGNGLYLYRKDEKDKELAAVQILDVNQQQPSFKFLKVRENAEGNLEVYEEIVEVHKESPESDETTSEKGICHVPIKDINEVINDHSTNKITERKIRPKEISDSINADKEREGFDSKNEAILNGKTVKINDNSRKSPVIGSFTPMTFHSTSNKERIPLTKTMVDMQLHPSRHNDSAKKTIEVNTDSCRHKSNESVFVDSKEIQKDVKTIDKGCSKFSDKIIENSSKHTIETQKQSLGAEASTCKKIESMNSRTASSKEFKSSPKIEQCNLDEKKLNPEIMLNILKNKQNSEIDKQAIIISDTNDTNASQKSVTSDNISTSSEILDRKIMDAQSNNNTDVLDSNTSTSKNSHPQNTPDNLCTKEEVGNDCKKEKITSFTKIEEAELFPHVDNDMKKQSKDKIKHESDNVTSKLDDYKDSNNTLVNSKLNLKSIPGVDAAHDKTKEVNNIVIKTEIEKNNEQQKIKLSLEKPKPLNNNIPVPFGKWTEANKQEYLNKIKESKVPSLSGSTNQIKQPKDLNRRDVLNKIDIARHTLQTKDSFNSVKSTIKSEAGRQINKPVVSVRENKTLNVNSTPKIQTDHTITSVKKSESVNRTEINNQDLIDKTIEGILMDKIVTTKVSQENDTKSNGDKVISDKAPCINFDNKYGIEQQTSILDDIERQLNELHGQPNKQKVNQGIIESKILSLQNSEVASVKGASNKIPSRLPLSGSNVTKQTLSKDIGEYSDEEILECEPITGDIELDQKTGSSVSPIVMKAKVDVLKEESGNVITEKDFDKFARRNSVTYENCMTVNFTTQQQTNLIKNIVPKDMTVKKDLNNTEIKSKSHCSPLSLEDRNKTDFQVNFSTNDMQGTTNNYKMKIGHHTSLNVKRQKESPITVIEDKPVKVIFVDSAAEFQPYQLNAQGQQLSSNKHKDTLDCDSYTVSSCDSLDSDILEAQDDSRAHEGIKVKTKHQRKQVLTPVDIPDMELIEPKDLGIETKHKRKRKTEDLKRHLEVNDDEPAGKRNAKNLVPKKSYLLGRTSQASDKECASKSSKVTNSEENILAIEKVPFKENMKNANDANLVYHHNVSNTIDDLVKAAELLEKQTENDTIDTSMESSPQPVKRGRGRPRKYPVQHTENNQVCSPQKKPKLTEAVVSKTETSDEDSDEEGIARENWTMGMEEVITDQIQKPTQETIIDEDIIVIDDSIHNDSPDIDNKTGDQGAGFRCEPCDKSFRKLHHLVEHRENHDNKMKLKNVPPCQNNVDKNSGPAPQCDICNKTFRKLHHMIEHREQHYETKNYEKTNNATLIARDIIHECSLCYMVFPNEHALNKHFIICQRKKKSAKLKKDEKKDGMPGLEKESVSEETSTNVSHNSVHEVKSEVVLDKKESVIEKCLTDNLIDVAKVDTVDEKYLEPIPVVESIETHHSDETEGDNNASVITENNMVTKTLETKEISTLDNTHEKKTPIRDKISLKVTKSNRTPRTSVAELTVPKNDVCDSDEDVRYMFNPNYKADETMKDFMKVRANRRNSLACGSTKLVTRRTSTRYSPKVHEKKTIEKPKNATRHSSIHLKTSARASPKKKNTVPLANVDSSSDESEIKYSFPKPINMRKSMKIKTVKTAIEKPKVLGNNVKRTPGKTVINNEPLSTKPEVKRRVKEVGHRCDCGQFFSSAALLTRHTTLMHTPPRRRRLSPPPPPPPTRASALALGTTPKPRRNGAHRGIPVTEKMKKIKDKLK